MSLSQQEFDKFLQDIVPTEIPVKFVNYVTIIFKNGRRTRLNKEDLLSPNAVANKGISWKKVKENFKEVQDVEIHIDIRGLKKHVNDQAKDILKLHFPGDSN